MVVCNLDDRSWVPNARGRAVAFGPLQSLRASVEEIAKSLQGNWRVEHHFALKQALGAVDFVGSQLAECAAQIEQQLQGLDVMPHAASSMNSTRTESYGNST